MSTEPRLGERRRRTRALWQVVSADGHTVSDAIAFTWAPADDVEISQGSARRRVRRRSGDRHGDGRGRPTRGRRRPPVVEAGSDPGCRDVLWIGGAVLAVGVAVAVTILVLGRRKPP